MFDGNKRDLLALLQRLEEIKSVTGLLRSDFKESVLNALEIGKVGVTFDLVRIEAMRIIKSGEDFNEDTISFLKEALRIKEISIELIRKGLNSKLSIDEINELSREYQLIDKLEIRKFILFIILKNIKILFDSILENIIYLFNSGRKLNIEADRINHTLKSLDDNEKEIILRVLFSEEEILDENKKSILKSSFSNFNEFIQRGLEFEETDTAKILIFLNSRNQSVINGIQNDINGKKSYEDALKSERVRVLGYNGLEFLGIGHRFEIIKKTKSSLGKYILFTIFFEGYINYDFDEFIEITANRINIETQNNKGNLEHIKKELIIELRNFLQIHPLKIEKKKEKKSLIKKSSELVTSTIKSAIGKNKDSLYSKLALLVGIDEESLKNIDDDEIINIIGKTKTYEGRKLIFNIFFVSIKGKEINYNIILDKLFVNRFIKKIILNGLDDRVKLSCFNQLMINIGNELFVNSFLYLFENSYIFSNTTVFSIEFIQLILDDINGKNITDKIEYKLSSLPRINGKVYIEKYFSSIRDTETKK